MLSATPDVPGRMVYDTSDRNLCNQSQSVAEIYRSFVPIFGDDD